MHVPATIPSLAIWTRRTDSRQLVRVTIALMTREDWFGLGVRLFGIWLLIDCLQELVAAAQIHFGLLTPYRTTLGAYFLHAAVEIAAGLYLIFGARSVVALAYRKDRADGDGDTPERTQDESR